MTQKDYLVFEEQTATREEELLLLELAHAEIKNKIVPWEHFLVNQVRGVDTREETLVPKANIVTCGAPLRLFEGDDGRPGSKKRRKLCREI